MNLRFLDLHELAAGFSHKEVMAHSCIRDVSPAALQFVASFGSFCSSWETLTRSVKFVPNVSVVNHNFLFSVLFGQKAKKTEPNLTLKS